MTPRALAAVLACAVTLEYSGTSAPGGFARSPGPATSPVPLHYDAALSGIGFPSPLARVIIGGRQVWFLVDTGAGVHTLAKWFVEAARIRTRETTGTVRGSTGVEAPVRTVDDLAGVYDDGSPFSMRQAIVTDLPPVFMEHQLAGLISPQLLAAPGEAAVLDLRAPTLAFRPFALAIAQLGLTTGRPSDRARVCRNETSVFTNRLFAVPVIASGSEGTFLMDAGATRTLVAPTSRIARILMSRSVEAGKTQGVGGTAQSTRTVDGVEITRGGATVTVDLIIGGSGDTCGPDGLLGMDALRACVAVLGDSAVALSCAHKERPGRPDAQ